MLMVIATIGLAMFFIGSSEIKKRYTMPSISNVFFLWLSVTICFIPLINISNIAQITFNQWIGIIIIGIFAIAIPIVCWHHVSKYLDVTTLSIVFNLTVIFTIIGEFVIGFANLTPHLIIATIFILIPVYLSNKIQTESLNS